MRGTVVCIHRSVDAADKRLKDNTDGDGSIMTENCLNGKVVRRHYIKYTYAYTARTRYRPTTKYSPKKNIERDDILHIIYYELLFFEQIN